MKTQETQEPQVYCVICQEDSKSSKTDEAKAYNKKVAAETVAVARKVKALAGTRPIRLITGGRQEDLISYKILRDELGVSDIYSECLSNNSLTTSDATKLIGEHLWDRNTAYIIVVGDELDGATFLYTIRKKLFNRTDIPHAKRIELTKSGWKLGMRTGNIESLDDAIIPVEHEID